MFNPVQSQMLLSGEVANQMPLTGKADLRITGSLIDYGSMFPNYVQRLAYQMWVRDENSRRAQSFVESVNLALDGAIQKYEWEYGENTSILRSYVQDLTHLARFLDYDPKVPSPPERLTAEITLCSLQLHDILQ